VRVDTGCAGASRCELGLLVLTQELPLFCCHVYSIAVVALTVRRVEGRGVRVSIKLSCRENYDAAVSPKYKYRYRKPPPLSKLLVF